MKKLLSFLVSLSLVFCYGCAEKKSSYNPFLETEQQEDVSEEAAEEATVLWETEFQFDDSNTIISKVLDKGTSKDCISLLNFDGKDIEKESLILGLMMIKAVGYEVDSSTIFVVSGEDTGTYLFSDGKWNAYYRAMDKYADADIESWGTGNKEEFLETVKIIDEKMNY